MFHIIFGVLLSESLCAAASDPRFSNFQATFTHPASNDWNLKAFAIGGTEIKYKPSIKTYISPDSLFVTCPLDAATAVNSAIGAKWERSMLAVDCQKLRKFPSLSFDFRHEGQVVLEAPEYLIRVGGNCFSPFLDEPEGLPEPFFDIGQPFIHGYQLSTVSTHHKQHQLPGIQIPLKPSSKSLPEPREIQLKRVILGNQRIQLDKTLLSVSSGLLVMHLPLPIANMLNSEIGATRNYLLSILECDTLPELPDLTLEISSEGIDVLIVLNSTDYIIRAGGSCFSPFVGLIVDNRQPWVIGDVFVYRYGLTV